MKHEFKTEADATEWAKWASALSKDRFTIVFAEGDKIFGQHVAREEYSKWIAHERLIASYRDGESYR